MLQYNNFLGVRRQHTGNFRARTRRAARALATFAVLSCAVAGARAGEPAARVVVSIAPLHSLISGVMAGVGGPTLLVRGGASPHGGALRPSDARALQAADVVFWAGPTLERFLNKPLATLAGRARVIALAEAPGLGEVGRHAAGAPDPHVWLDPAHARVLVAVAAAVLAEADPGNAEAYRANATRLRARLDALDRDLAARLAPVRDVPYLVFHDAYRHFEARYGLTSVGAVTRNPEIPPGARRLSHIRRLIAESGVACLFTEPRSPPALAQAVTGDAPVRIAVLDPLGAALAPGPEAYFALMRALADDLAACLRRD